MNPKVPIHGNKYTFQFCVYTTNAPSRYVFPQAGPVCASRASEIQGLQDRCERKLFSSAVLKPKSETYINISQKVLSATAARYMIFWLCNLVKALLADATFEKSQAFLPLVGKCL